MKLSVVCRRLRLNGMALNQARKRFGVEDEEEWALHSALQNTIGQSVDLRHVVIHKGGGPLATNPNFSPTFSPSTSLIYHHNNILRLIFL